MRAVGPFLHGALYTLTVLGGGFLVFVGVVGLASSGDPWFGGTFFAIGVFCLVFGLGLLAVRIVGWRRLWRRGEVPNEEIGESE